MKQQYLIRTFIWVKSVLTITFVLTGFIYGQAPFHVWTDRIPNSNYTQGPATVEVTNDGGFVTAGNVDAQSALNIMKFSSTGQLQWSSDFGPSYGCAAYAACQLNDSGYVAVGIACPLGFQSNESWDVYAVRTDKNGNLLWSNTYSGGDMADAGYWVQQTQDGGIIIGGYTTIPSGPEQGYQNACLIKTDINGNMLWNKQYSLASNNNSLVLVKGAQLNDGSLVLGCYASNGGVIIKTDKNGVLQWSKEYNFDNNSFTPYSMRVTRDNGFIMAGAASYPNWGAIKIDSTGAVQWTKSYAPTFPQPYGYAFDVEELNYGYAFVGYFYDYPAAYSTSYLMKTDPDGNILWTRTFNEEYWDWLNSVKQTADGGLIIWGMTQIVNSAQRGSLIKTDSMGLGTCKYSTQAMAATSYTATVADITLTVSTGFTQSASPNNYPVSPSPEYFPCANIPVANFSASNSMICAGSQVKFNDLSANNPTGWSWYFAGGSPDTSSSENPAVTYDTAGVYSVTLIATNSIGADTFTQSGYITVVNLSVIGTAIANPDTVCSGDSSVLAVTGSEGNIQWQSSTGDSSFSTILLATSAAYNTAALLQTTAYRWIVGSGICTDTSAPITVEVNPLPVPVVTTADSLICSNDSTQVCSSNSFVSYSWNTTDTLQCTTAKQGGDYYVTVTDANGCSAESNHAVISVYPVPSVSIIQNGDTISSFGQVSYQWLLNGDSISNATGSFYIANGPGAYSVQVTDSDGCTATSNAVTVTGMDELTEEGVSIYPNPSISDWQLTVGDNLKESNLEVYNDEGSLIFRSTISNLTQRISLNVAKGVYWLRISNDRVSVVRKLVRL